MTSDAIEPNVPIQLAPRGGIADQVHVFEPEDVSAIHFALAARRPLLLRGEPGTGKSQFARAAAKALGRAFVSHVVDARTESRDLLWRFDAVERLADAQLEGALGAKRDAVREALAVTNYVTPGPLWWAFNWTDAMQQANRVGSPAPPQPDDGQAANGVVLLVDEIDKAETDVPNGLLEALGDGAFTPFGAAQPVECGDTRPLVIITTNEERALPDAFLRRCAVWVLRLPDDDSVLLDWLVQRGQAHFPTADGDLLREAARQVAADRRTLREERRTPLPGQAEYLDLLRAVTAHTSDRQEQMDALRRLARYALDKSPRDI